MVRSRILRLENLVLKGRGNPRSLVGHPHLEPAIILAAGNGDISPAVFLHRIAGIGQQVDEDLLVTCLRTFDQYNNWSGQVTIRRGKLK